MQPAKGRIDTDGICDVANLHVDLLETIRIVRAGSKWISPDVAAQLVSRMGEDGKRPSRGREEYSGQARAKRSNPCGDAGAAPGNY
jgi:hypothetical protein